MSSDRRELAGIQQLRAVAVLLVVLDHTEGMLAMPKYFGVHFFGGLFSLGTVGVDLFFVISGFIIYHVTEGLDSAHCTGIDFAKRRFFRIIPFLWLCIAFHYLVRSLYGASVDPQPYVRAAVLYPVGEVSPSQVWTLRHEVFFYIFCGLYLIHPRMKWPLAVFLLLPVGVALVSPDIANTPEGSNFWTEVFSLRSNLGFLFGLVCGYLHRRGLVGRFLDRISTNLTVGLAPIVLLGCEYLVAVIYDSTSSTVVGATLVSMASAALVVSALPIVPNGLPSKILEAIGTASYSIYLTHDAIISFAAIFCKKLHINSVYAATFAALILTVVLGYAIHSVVEKPLVRGAKALFINRDLRRTPRHL